MDLFNVWALSRIDSMSGDYRSLVMLSNYDPSPDTDIIGYVWVKIARNVNEDEAEAIMNQYPSVSRAKC